MAIKARFLGREAVTRRLHNLVPDAEKEAAIAQLEAAEEVAAAISAQAPKATGRYSQSIEGARIADRPTQTAIGFTDKRDPNATGVFADYIWRFLEFGTIRIAARPHVLPTYRAMKKRIRRKVAGAINKAVRKARR